MSATLVGESARTTRIVLASGSAIRATMLRNAGVSIDVIPAELDESPLKRSMRAQQAGAADCATALAISKARNVSSRRPDALVIGADQMLECDGTWFDKPDSLAQAATQLRALRGKTHALISAVAVARDATVLWQHVGTARLTMRTFSDSFLDAYLAVVGDAACRSVGAYQLEAVGIQLFSHVDGDHFTILGLPLLPLLEFLRRHAFVPA